MRRILCSAALLALVPLLAAAQDPQAKPGENGKPTTEKPKTEKPNADKPPTPSAQYQELLRAYAKERQKYLTLLGGAKTYEERQALALKHAPRPEAFAGRFLEFAEEHADDPAGFDALVWVVTNVQGFGPDAAQTTDRAITRLAEKHLGDERLKGVVQRLAYTQSPSVEKLLRLATENSPHRDVQGHACFSLAQYLKRLTDGATFWTNADEKQVVQFKAVLGEEMLEYLKRFDVANANKEIEQLCEQVIAKYGDVPGSRGTLGEEAEHLLFEIRFLAIGKVAPDIAGEDLDGAAFQLSDYRGKVVVLDFWGDW